MNRDNDKKLAQLKAQIARARIEKEQDEMNAQTKLEVSIVQAEQNGNVLLTEVKGEQNIVQSKVQAQVIENINRQKAEAQVQMKNVDQQAQVMFIEAKSRYDAAQARRDAQLEEGQAEMKNLEAFDAQRKFEYELRKTQVYEQLAQFQGNIVISGKTGENMLQSILDGGEKRKN